MVLLVLAVLLAALVVAGCADDGGGSQSGGRVPVVATTTQVADLVANVGGERVQVRPLLSPNADPHDFEPRPSDAEAVLDARLLVRSGGDLDDWTGELTDAVASAAPVIDLSESVRTLRGGHGHAEEAGHEEEADPHWWHDPRNAVRAVEAVRAALVRVDPGARADYDGNARAYTRRIERLDGRIAACLRRVPASQRKLVTTHDALGHLAARYDIEVIGSVLDSLSTQAQPSAGDVRALVAQMRARGVRTLFAESGVAPRVERAIAAEAGARVGEALWADTLGPPGSNGATYLGSMAANANALARGFTGGAVDCALAPEG